MRRFSHMLFLITLCLASAATSTAQKPQLVVQTGHGETIYALAISPDKKLLASGGIDQKVIIWDIASGKQLYSLTEHTQAVLSLAFSHDNKLLASGSADGSVKIWDVARGVRVENITLQSKGVACVAFSLDGKKLAIAGANNVINIWDIAARKETSELQGYKQIVEKIAFTPDGKSLVSFSRDHALVNWNFESKKVTHVTAYEEKVSMYTALAVSPDSNYAAVSSNTSNFLLWNLKNGKKESIPFPADPKKEGSTNISHVVFASNEELICDGNDQILSWNFRTKKVTKIADIPDSTGSALTISGDSRLLVYSYGENIRTLELDTKISKDFRSGFETIYNLEFYSDGRTLITTGKHPHFFGDGFEFDQLEAGTLVARLNGARYEYISAINSLANFGEIPGGYGSPNIELEVLQANSKPTVIKAHSESINSMSVHPDGKLLATCSQDKTIKIWDVLNWQAPKKTLNEHAQHLAFSPDRKWLAVVTEDRKLKLLDTNTWQSRVLFAPEKGGFGRLFFSPDGVKLASHVGLGSTEQYLMVWDVTNSNQNRVFKLDPLPQKTTMEDLFKLSPFPGLSLMSILSDYTASERTRGSLSFSKDSRFIAHQYKDVPRAVDSIKIWDLQTGEEVRNLVGHTGVIRTTTFSPNGKILASGGNDTTLKLWEIKTGKELATVSTLSKDKWVIYTPEGRFDTNIDLEGDDILHWSIPGSALKTLPLDVFMRDYYEPKLFERLLNCTENGTCERGEFKKVRSLSELNIVRPEVNITNVSLPDANREVHVTVEVSRASGVVEQENGLQVPRTTDVYDLRLFRDRQLVGDEPYDGVEKIAQRKAEIDGSKPESKFETELKLWRTSERINLDPQTGKRVVTFKVQLPKGKDAASVNFTAYAFNEDRVKSQTAKYEWTPEQKAKLPKAEPNVKRRAYIISVGVNRYKISSFNLIHADYDANQFQTVVPEKLRATGAYEVVPVRLVSGYENENRRLVRNATKQNIETVFRLLAGKEVSPEAEQKIPNAEQIAKATPDDLIIITFSSHGYSNKNGDFYLLPSDITKRTSSQEIPDLSSMISGEELALWLHDIEADEMALIIDSCQAAAAVESLDFKPGPFGSRGFGQLAYDKQLKVLAATQAENRALQANDEIKGGLLTYALVTEGLVEGRADGDSEKDGKITLNEWLNYGANRVHKLYRAVVRGEKKGLVWKKVHKSKDLNTKQLQLLQRAMLFNFAQQESDLLLCLISSK